MRVKMLAATIVTAAVGAGTAQGFQTTLPHKPFKKMSLTEKEAFQVRSLKYHRYVARNGRGKPRSWHAKAARWTLKELRETRAAKRPAVSNAAWLWYLSPTTQCVVNHEGGWTSVNSAGPGYFGRFQMDPSFQRETEYGRKAYARYGTADHWPPEVQVTHAYDVWSRYGWSRWPTYARYCA